MTKTELEQAIKKNESVWFIFYGAFGMKDEIMKLDLKNDYTIKDNYLFNGNEIIFPGRLSSLYKSKDEAEHYLHHANITRVEQLPFLTWEEFLKEKYIWFVDKEQNQCCLYYVTKFILINKNGELIEMGELTEQNFYKAYDECVKLFRGE